MSKYMFETFKLVATNDVDNVRTELLCFLGGLSLHVHHLLA